MDRGIIPKDGPTFASHLCCQSINELFNMSRFQVLVFEESKVDQAVLLRNGTTTRDVGIGAVFTFFDQRFPSLGPVMSPILVWPKGALIDLHNFVVGKS